MLHGSIAGVLLFLTLVFTVAAASSSASGQEPLLRAQTLSLTGLVGTGTTRAAGSLESAAVPLTVLAPPVSQQAVLNATDTTSAAVRALNAASGGGDGTTSAARSGEQKPLFYRYQVQQGDTLSGIAARFGVSAQHIVWNNIDLILDQNQLTVGDRLQIPSVEGMIHQVRVAETLTEIAAKYDASVADIIGFPANNLADPNMLKEGSTILVPGGRLLTTPSRTLRPQPAAPPVVVPPPGASAASAAPASKSGFVWPVVDMITSYFGPSHPLGIDINAPFVPVRAASAGQVLFAGGDPCCSYGLYVDIRHDQGYETRYAHLSSVAVKLGQFVQQGQVIGISGATGRATGAHLHFELRRNGIIQDPMAFLP